MKKLILTAALAAIGLGAYAEGESYLFWMIDPDSKVTQYHGEPTAVSDYSVKIGYVDNGATRQNGDGAYASASYLNIYGAPDTSAQIGTGGPVSVADYGLQDTGVFTYLASSTDFTGKKFFLELYNEKSDLMGYSTTEAAYADLADFIGTMSGSEFPAQLYQFSGFQVPEPSSGVLMLIGCAALALRRRRMQKKA